jgi:hypothetical protein
VPIQSLRLIPGLNTERTPSLNEAGFSATSLIRWRDGLPEKLGGWQRFYPAAIGSKIFALNAWTSYNNVSYLGIGAASSLNVLASGSLTNLTPQVFTSNIAPAFTTTLGSKFVTVADTNTNGLTTYSTINISTPVSIGGIILFGQYVIQSISSTTSYVISAASAATSNAGPAGTVPSFTTVAQSYTVNVTLASHGLSAGSTLNFPISTTVGGAIISGIYTVQSVVDPNNFTIVVSASATSAAGPTFMNSGNARIIYNIGLAAPSGGSGWGTGGYGTGGWGNTTGSAPQTGTPITATDWTLANWGENLICCPKGGTIYYWPPESGYQTAIPVPNAPAVCNGVMIAMPQQILVAWGSTTSLSLGLAQDPLLVSWSTAGDFTVWGAQVNNLAGSFRLPRGSQIVGGFQSSFQTLLFTDIECYAMNYIGYPLVFSFNKVGNNCGLIGRAAVAELGGAVLWMGPSNFYGLSGSGVQPIPCPVWDAVFQNLDRTNAYKTVAGSNSTANEIWWWFPSLSGGTGENDTYVKFNTVLNAWDTGPMSRTAWLDQSILGAPVAAGIDQYLYQHEVSPDAAGTAMSPSFTTGYFAVAEGEQIVFLDWFLPDMRFGPYGASQSANVQFTFNTLMYTGDTPTVYGPYTVTSSTEYIPLRFRARFVSVTVSSSDTGSFWRLGRPRFRWAPDGRR